MPWSTWNRLVQEKKKSEEKQKSYDTPDLYMTFLKARGWSGLNFLIFAFSTSNIKVAMTYSSAVHGGQYDTKYVTFE